MWDALRSALSSKGVNVTWQCPACNDWFDKNDDDVPPVCIMCRKVEEVKS